MPLDEKVVRPNEDFLNKTYVEQKVLQLVEPNLFWLENGFLNQVQTNAKAVWGKRELYTSKSDPKKRRMRRRTSGAKFTRVSISEMESVTTTIGGEGFEIRIDEDAERYPEGVDEIQRSQDRLARWLADSINMTTNEALIAGVRKEEAGMRFYDSTLPDWAEPTADPFADLKNFKRDMKITGYPFTMSDVFLDEDHYELLVDRLLRMNVTAEDRKQIWGVPDAGQAVLYIPALNLYVRSVELGILADGAMLGIDRKITPATFYYSSNPRYATKKANEIGFHLNKFEDQETHDIVFQAWCDYGIQVKEPGAGLYGVSGI